MKNSYKIYLKWSILVFFIKIFHHCQNLPIHIPENWNLILFMINCFPETLGNSMDDYYSTDSAWVHPRRITGNSLLLSSGYNWVNSRFVVHLFRILAKLKGNLLCLVPTNNWGSPKNTLSVYFKILKGGHFY